MIKLILLLFLIHVWSVQADTAMSATDLAVSIVAIGVDASSGDAASTKNLELVVDLWENTEVMELTSATCGDSEDYILIASPFVENTIEAEFRVTGSGSSYLRDCTLVYENSLRKLEFTFQTVRNQLDASGREIRFRMSVDDFEIIVSKIDDDFADPKFEYRTYTTQTLWDARMIFSCALSITSSDNCLAHVGFTFVDENSL